MDQAYFDAQLDLEDQEGLMHCWCYNEALINLNLDALNQEFSSIKEGDTKQYCNIWFEEYAKYQSLEYGISLLPVVINAFVTWLFQTLVPYGKFYSRNGETETTFILTTVFQFANFALLDILLNFRV